ncbi:FkbM family methyltransferase [Pedobacter rhodius]|uniref:FkbM family methyltransferase n=1 Tax=Pedobacter rhodius TaxID=3004098 RepID=A0ABT4KSU3_9SPHI|nr:FkbM family methyltransferase [Pedobacter sp. SJ11]MCZ4221791.1 FkbM family methyltransferase [Pedobacter sp. SJ11]
MQNLYKFILRRPFFRGQDRLFNYFFINQKFKKQTIAVKPLEGNFKINCDCNTWIGGKIVYTGDYEPELKKIFKSIINPGDYILDVGANIGFHTLYFAQLTGGKGLVTAFEPIPDNYKSLNNNIQLNNFSNIITHNVALSNKKEQISIQVDLKSTNPGAYNLFELNGDVPIECVVGDDIVDNQKVDFIKIDVEGYESYVLDGLIETIKKNKPKIIFEFDQDYHRKTSRSEDYILFLLASLGYQFQYINRDGLKTIESFKNLVSGNILALPNE